MWLCDMWLQLHNVPGSLLSYFMLHNVPHTGLDSREARLVPTLFYCKNTPYVTTAACFWTLCWLQPGWSLDMGMAFINLLKTIWNVDLPDNSTLSATFQQQSISNELRPRKLSGISGVFDCCFIDVLLCICKCIIELFLPTWRYWSFSAFFLTYKDFYRFFESFDDIEFAL